MGDRCLRDAHRDGGGDPRSDGQRIGAGLGVPGSLAGLIITTHGLFVVLTSPLAGALIDRYGPQRPYALGLVLYAFAGGALETVSWQLPFGVYLLALPLGALAFLPVPEPAVATSDRESNGGPGNSESGIGGVVNAFRGTPLLIFVYGLHFAANALCTRSWSTICSCSLASG
jgi:MFS family permease